MDFLLVALMAVFGWMKKSKSDKKIIFEALSRRDRCDH